MNTPYRRAVFHFHDNTTLALEWPKQDTQGLTFVSEALRKAIQTEHLIVEAEGHLLVIQTKNLNYVEVIPAPEQLPEGAIRGARRLADLAAATAPRQA